MVRLGGLVLAAVLFASCGGSSSDESGSPTTLSENNTDVSTAGPTDTLPSKGAAPTDTLPSKGAAPTDESTKPDATTDTVAPVEKEKVTPVAPAVVVADPGNFSPTYLASTDELGAPRPILPAEASLESNASRAVSTALRTDASGVLAVTAASWVGSTPMTLRWTITTSTGSLQCDNCAFVTTKTKRLIKEVTSVKFDGSGIKSIRGLDLTATKVGEFAGNGWGVELLVGDPGDIEASATGNAIRDLLLSCAGTTASTCKNVSLGAAELKWKNQVWSTSDCVSALRNGGPRQLIDGVAAALKGASAETAALVRQRAALDRVVVGLPAYRPVFSSSGTTRTLTGFASTGCAS
jgi:hypothetical protein